MGGQFCTTSSFLGESWSNFGGFGVLKTEKKIQNFQKMSKINFLSF